MSHPPYKNMSSNPSSDVNSQRTGRRTSSDSRIAEEPSTITRASPLPSDCVDQALDGMGTGLGTDTDFTDQMSSDLSISDEEDE